jgi:hypothetical protein
MRLPHPKIFLSHSARSDQAAAILAEIYRLLTERHFDVLLDRARLDEEAGRPWRTALNTWMELCQGGVILMDEGALRSDWVRHEASILAWRHNRDSRFQLVPIVVPPVTAAQFSEFGFAPSDIAALQVLTARTPTDAPVDRCGPPRPCPDQDHVDTLCRRFEALRAGRRELTSIERIEDLLASDLRSVDPELIQQASSTLGEDLGRWSPNVAPSRALARLLLRAGLMDSIPVLGHLPLEPLQFQRVSRLLATAWINCRAVEPIRRIAQGPEQQRSIAINSDEPLLSGWYLLRAGGAATAWPQIEVRLGTAEDDPDAVIARIDQALLLRGPPHVAGIAEKRYLSRFRSPTATQAGPIFLTFASPEPDPDILDRLRQEFPAFTFFLRTGSYVPPPQQELSRRGGYFLRPEIQTDAADQAINAWLDAHHRLFPTSAW